VSGRFFVGNIGAWKRLVSELEERIEGIRLHASEQAKEVQTWFDEGQWGRISNKGLVQFGYSLLPVEPYRTSGVVTLGRRDGGIAFLTYKAGVGGIKGMLLAQTALTAFRLAFNSGINGPEDLARFCHSLDVLLADQWDESAVIHGGVGLALPGGTVHYVDALGSSLYTLFANGEAAEEIPFFDNPVWGCVSKTLRHAKTLTLAEGESLFLAEGIDFLHRRSLQALLTYLSGGVDTTGNWHQLRTLKQRLSASAEPELEPVERLRIPAEMMILALAQLIGQRDQWEIGEFTGEVGPPTLQEFSLPGDLAHATLQTLVDDLGFRWNPQDMNTFRAKVPVPEKDTPWLGGYALLVTRGLS